MREIKFRTWDGTKIYPVESIHFDIEVIDVRTDCEDIWCDGHLFEYAFNEVQIMQYTGLKDKNGVEIYEGDIVVYDNWKPKEVIYEGGLGFMGFRLKNTELFLMGYDWRHYEVIGNIYENPELLK